MHYQTTGMVICSCFSLHLLIACNPPTQYTHAGQTDISRRVAADTTDFQAKVTDHSQAISVLNQGVTAPPQGITAPPEGITAPPQGITAPPEGVTAPPEGVTAPPQGIVWVESLSRLSLALANYHEVDASFYDTQQLSQTQGSGTFSTQLLGGVTQVVDKVVDSLAEDLVNNEETLPVEGEQENTHSDTENTSSSPLANAIEGVVNTVLNEATTTTSHTLDTVTQTTTRLRLLDQLTGLSLSQWLSQFVGVPKTSLYRLQSRKGEVQVGMITPPETSEAVFGLYLQAPSGLQREVLSLRQFTSGAPSEWAFKLTEVGPGFVRSASRTHVYLSASTQQTVTRAFTRLNQGGTIEVFEKRLTDRQGLGVGEGFILLTSATGQQQRFHLLSTARSGALLTQVDVGQGQTFSIDENSLGQAVAKLSDTAQTEGQQMDLDFNRMLLALGQDPE